MFYSHSQAREKLPRKRRRVLPVDQVKKIFFLIVHIIIIY